MNGCNAFQTALIHEVRDSRFEAFRRFGRYLVCPLFPDHLWCLSYEFYVVKTKATTSLDFRNKHSNHPSYRWQARKRRFDFLTDSSRFPLLKGSFNLVSPSAELWGNITSEYPQGSNSSPEGQGVLRRLMIADLERLADWLEPYLGDLRGLCSDRDDATHS